MLKLSKEVKNLMERELRQYKDNKRLLNRLKADSTTPSRAIIICEDRMRYIENVLKKLSPFEKQMFENIFYENYDWNYCQIKYNVSKSTYYNIFNKCIILLAQEWGES